MHLTLNIYAINGSYEGFFVQRPATILPNNDMLSFCDVWLKFERNVNQGYEGHNVIPQFSEMLSCCDAKLGSTPR